ncbi:hypothetical protein SJAV_25910 [Sulfurisphaera javensis]|uniref:Type II secretion system protein GspF domain-containing protein n=1 Tax=Sulfurisphaera javensis TaxID=2049879 RepID=A0AAT9GUL2_9CREN
MNLFPWLILIISSSYASSLCVVSNKMKKRAKTLSTKVKKLIALQFIEKSVDLLSESEFAELMDEVSMLTNVEIHDSNGLFYELYQKFPKIEKELKELMIRISVVNKIDSLTKELERKSTTLRISSGILFFTILGFTLYITYCPYLQILSLMQYLTTGFMITLPLIIADSLRAYYESDKIFRLIYN